MGVHGPPARRQLLQQKQPMRLAAHTDLPACSRSWLGREEDSRPMLSACHTLHNQFCLRIIFFYNKFYCVRYFKTACDSLPPAEGAGAGGPAGGLHHLQPHRAGPQRCVCLHKSGDWVRLWCGARSGWVRWRLARQGIMVSARCPACLWYGRQCQLRVCPALARPAPQRCQWQRGQQRGRGTLE